MRSLPSTQSLPRCGDELHHQLHSRRRSRYNTFSRYTLIPFVVVIVLLQGLGLIPAVEAHPAAVTRPESPKKLGTVVDPLVCRNEDVSPFDYSVKRRVPDHAPVCPAPQKPIQDQTHTLFARQVTNDDYSCSETKPCSNGACCSKKTGYCNYGPEACGTNGQSPNDVCWSNCDAHAECGRYASPAGKECPLKVCCGPWGFCGMTSEFCTKDPDITKGCQSNCDQPGSGKSGGNVQSRIIGYYEAWAHDRTCTGMDFESIPVGSLTHLFFSFGYITPGDFMIVPMDDLPVKLFTRMTDLKRSNPGLKCVVALGGWTFNDPGPTQKVFSDMVSTEGKRRTFITNLLSFLRQYAFDGVDFDWEYPGADDRGGSPDDGINFTQFLKELREAISKEPQSYVVSYTIPTSYWYLRHFDLKSVDYVDFVNVMSYDLHGTWDSNNPIGNNVLAHTNLTEIKLALDLLWRNSVDATKLNLGIGFYGRSFQLSDPACFRPGCKFKGGAAPGGCTANSGTLSYKEIMQIIDQYKLKPFYEKESEVKYIVWNQDQWVSYDDEETIQAKIKFANDLGLGGLLIWSVDQDTPDLSALKALWAPKALNLLSKSTKDTSYWEDVTAQDCYVTECGGSCKPGFIKVTNQPCGGAKPVTRRAKEKDSALCCPISSAPDPKTCRWRGGDPSCNGHCHEGEVALQMNKWGDGWYCEDGNKIYCCDVPAAKDIGCYWTDGNCKSGDTLRTFKGTFLSTIADILRLGPLFGDILADIIDDVDIALSSRYCCSPTAMKRWKNCNWYGEPGSCYDNHCEIGHQVQLTDSKYGAGVSCFPRSERTRVFCCEPGDGEPLFPPVPMRNLFPSPPSEDDPVDFDIKIDNTWGDGVADTSTSDDPDQATFGFWVLTSPEEIQISLDKRDGSHWELLNCENASHDPDEPKTIQMVCMDMSKDSNCDKIYLGHGVPGTIVELPKGCGPSKYAVAKSLEVAKNQTMPARLARRVKREFGVEKPVVYDFTFDFEWRRVPRDLGDTQMRVDYSNEVGYWDNIVEKAASNSKRKVKRSLDDTRGSHRRWLEEEWREDYHLSSLSKDDLHKRWFGSDIIDWLRNLLSPNIKPEFTHNIDESFTAILIQEEWPGCTLSNGIKISGHMDVRASARVKVATSFGLTIIAKLDFPNILDLSNSYLYFKNRGEVTAIFTLDAEGKAVYSTGDRELVGLQNFPGATFSIPKLLTVGPNFKLFASADADVTLKGHIESRVDIASWDVQQTYPNPSSEYNPKSLTNVARDMTLKDLTPPTFDYSLSAEGQLTAHLKPTFIFGIDFDSSWNVGGAKVSLVADGWMRMYAKAELTNDPEVCPFVYGIDVGADLFAKLEVPSLFSNWNGQTFPIATIPAKKLVDGNTCPQKSSSLARVRRTAALDSEELGLEHEARSYQPALGITGASGSAGSSDELMPIVGGHMSRRANPIRRRTPEFNSSSEDLKVLSKRGITIGPLIRFPPSFFPCPNPPVSDPTKCADITGWDDGEDNDPDYISKRGVDVEFSGKEDMMGQHLNFFEKRATKKQINFCMGFAKMRCDSPSFDSSGDIVTAIPTIKTYAPLVPDQCNDFTFGIVPNRAKGAGSNTVATEHVLEFQLLPLFFDAMQKSEGSEAFDNPEPKPADDDDTVSWKEKVDLCHYMKPYWYDSVASWITINGAGPMRAAEAVGLAFPSRTDYTSEWLLLDKGANTAKERMWGDGQAVDLDPSKWPKTVSDNPDKAIKKTKDFIMAYKYHCISTVQATLKRQANRVGTQLEAVEDILVAKTWPEHNAYQKIGLKAKWDTWIKGRWLLAKQKAENHLTNGLADLKKAHGGDPEEEEDANKKTLMTKIKMLEEEIDRVKGTWSNPFT